MELTHWIGVVLATPAVAVVLLASWRAHAARRAAVPTRGRSGDPRPNPRPAVRAPLWHRAARRRDPRLHRRLLVRHGNDVDGSDFIVFEVNGWHNIVHILSGLLGLALWRRRDAARAYALGFGAVYLVVTIWGFITGDQVLWLIPVDTADNVLHLLIAVAGLAAGLSSRDDVTAPRATPRTV
jgi:uncharacterized protein DUF4383